MEVHRPWPTRTKNRYRWFVGIVGKIATGLLAAQLLGGCSGKAAAENYVDCQQHPDGTAKGTIDTLGKSAINIGDAAANPEGDELRWEEKITLEALGNGTFAITVDGFGPILHQRDIASDPSPAPILTNASSGSQLTLTAPPVEVSGTAAPVTATYTC